MGETLRQLGDNRSQIGAGELRVAVAAQRGLLRHGVVLPGCCSALTPLQGAKALLEKSVCAERPASTMHPPSPRCCGSEQLPQEEARGAGVSPHRCFCNEELHNRRKWSRASVLQ